jgi:prevent-host-death family protein
MKSIMRSMTAHDAKAKFGQLLEAAREGPVAISKHGRAVAVIISKEEFDAAQALKLERLRTEVQKGFDSIERGDFIEVSAGGLAALGDPIKAEGRKRKRQK